MTGFIIGFVVALNLPDSNFWSASALGMLFSVAFNEIFNT